MPTPIDRYNKSVTGDDALKFEPPPAPAAPTNDPNLMRLYVPSENTELDFGAGKTPGIRMATDRHVHLTARTPATTISLGSPVVGVTGSAGYNLKTEGGKWEDVKGPVSEWYHAGKLEIVKGPLREIYEGTKLEIVELGVEETYKNTKKETVRFAVTEDYQNAHFYNVGDIAKYTFARDKDEHIAGNWVVDVAGRKLETIQGDHRVKVTGDWASVKAGISNEVFIGAKTSTNVLLYMASNLGGYSTRTIGVKQEIVAGVSYGKSIMKKETTHISKKDVTVEVTDTETASLSKCKSKIEQAALYIIK